MELTTHKASVTAPVSESKTAFWNWKVVNIPSQFLRSLSSFSVACCSENSGILQTNLNDMEENSFHTITRGGSTDWCYLCITTFLKMLSKQYIWERSSLDTYLSPTLVLLAITNFSTLCFTQIWLMAWHALGVLSTATLFFNFLGSKIGGKKGRVFLIQNKEWKIKPSTTTCKEKLMGE